MNTRKKSSSPYALIAMLCAAFIFTLTSAIPLKAQETATEFKPIGASPGTVTPVAPPTELEIKPADSAKSKEPADSTKSSKPAESTKSPEPAKSAKSPKKPKVEGVGAAVGGTGSSTPLSFGGVSLKKALIIGASVVGVAALLIAGGGGGSSNGGGTTPSH
jgi:cytoskeletal protein RodZ